MRNDPRRHTRRLLLAALLAPALLGAGGGRRFSSLTPWALPLSQGGQPVAASQRGPFGSNPAAAASVKRASLGLAHLSWIADLGMDSAGYLQPLGRLSAVRGAVSLFSMAPFDSSEGLDEPAYLSSLIAELGGAKGLPGLGDQAPDLGVNLKMIRTSFQPGGVMQEYDLDFGALWAPDFIPLRVGLAAHDLPAFGDHSPASCWQAGLGWESRAFQAYLQLERPSGEEPVSAMSLAWRPLDWFVARIGWAYPAGGHLGLEGEVAAWRAAFSVAPQGDLGSAAWIGLSRDFGEAADNAPPGPPGPPLPTAPPRRILARSPKPADGDFSLQAWAEGLTVFLQWDELRLEDGSPARYLVTMSMLEGASFRRQNPEPLSVTAWSGEMGLRGVTCRFQIVAIGPDGAELGRSQVKSCTLE